MFNLSASAGRVFRRGFLVSIFSLVPLSLAAQDAPQQGDMQMQGGHAGHTMGTMNHSMPGPSAPAAEKKKPAAQPKPKPDVHADHAPPPSGAPGGSMRGMTGMLAQSSRRTPKGSST